MLPKPFCLEGVIEGENSVIFQTSFGSILYEKLANTIHSGDRESLLQLQERVESIDYHPSFESFSLKTKKEDKLETLLLNVTESCNLSCSYCIYSEGYENERTETDLDMDFETAKKAIDIFMPLSRPVVSIGFYGGEPLNNMNLIESIIDYIRKEYSKKDPIFLVTSNFCEGHKHIKTIIENEFYVNVSLDGPKQIHDRNRRFKDGRFTYDKIIENLEKISRASPGYLETHFSQNVTCADPRDLPEILKFLQGQNQLKVSRINLLERKGLKDSMDDPEPRDIFNLVSDYIESILSGKNPAILGRIFDQGLRDIATRDLKQVPERLMLNGCCYPGNRKLFVDTEGKFYMCEKFGRRASIGNVDEGINQDSINRIIEEFKQIRNDCCTKGCWAQRLCNSCIQSSKDPQGDTSKEGLLQTCERSKSSILLALSVYSILLNENRKISEEYINSIKLK